MDDYFTVDDKIFPLSQMPAAMLELAHNSHLNTEELVRGTGIFLEDLSNRHRLISGEQVRQLITNVKKRTLSQEFPLRFGRQLPYISNSLLLQAIINASNIRDLLEILRDNCRLYYPLCFLHLVSDTHHHYLVVNDAVGFPQGRAFIYQVFISSLITLLKNSDIDSRQLGFYLEQSPPDDTAPLQTYLGHRIRYNAPVTAVVIPEDICQKPLTNPSDWVKQQALQQCQEQLDSLASQKGFLESLHKWLLRRATREEVTLHSSASAFGMSPATFKRRLKHHHSSFQLELDNARKLLALSSLVVKHMNYEDTARILRINDNANFRRSFKRWTGRLPSRLQDELLNF